MNRLVRTEWLKQRCTPVLVGGFLAAPVLAGLVVLAVFGAAGQPPNEPLGPESLRNVVAASTPILTTLALILGVLGMAGEYRHQTATTTFLASPRRRDVVVAKLTAHATAGAAMAVAAIIVTLAVAVPWLGNADVPAVIDAQVLRVACGLVASTALHAALGVAIGALIRNQTAAVAVVLTWLLAVEGLLSELLGAGGVVTWLPAAVGAEIVRPAGDGSLPPVLAGAVFAGYVAVAALAATRLQARRDIR